jgi:type IV pilus assembly protein PilY1
VSGDVHMSNGWRTMLVSGLRAGGAGFMALDVTSPTAADETALSKKVLCEFSNAATPSATANSFGLSFGKPSIAKVNGHGWVVMVTLRYNNTAGDGKGHISVLKAETGALIADLPKSAGTPSGLGQISAYTANGRIDATVDTFYGGDLLGNVWRFNLSGAPATCSAVRFATLTDSSNLQPITSALELSNVTTIKS